MRLIPEDVYEKNAKTVYRYLLSLTQDADISEELTQETFLQAWKSRDNFRGDSSVAVWLCGIAKRLWYKELERRNRNVITEDSVLDVLDRRETDQEQQKIRKTALYQAMQKLDPDTREVIHLRLTGDFSFREIGEILDRTENWARVRYYRGKQQLTEIMKGAEDD